MTRFDRRLTPDSAARGGPRSALAARGGGFTLIELILVVCILALLFGIGSVSMQGLMPKYYLRSSARAIGTKIENLRLSAISRGKWMGIRYDITPTDSDESYYQVVPPAPEDFPDEPVDQRQLLPPEKLSTGVRISKVILANNKVYDRGAVNILFSPMGNAGSHIVVLEGLQGRVTSVRLNSLTGILDVIEGEEVLFQHYEE